MFDLLFLGTGASVPSRDRALPAVVVRRGNDVVLFDCGEGTQRQFMVSRISFMKVSAVFITHLHGDHFYGLPGLLQTMGMMGRKSPLILRGPEGFAEALERALSVCPGEMEYELDIRDMSPGEFQTVGELVVSSFSTDHGVPSQGYLVKEPDTRGHIDMEKAKELGVSGRQDLSRIVDGEEVNGVVLKDICPDVTKGKTVAYTGDTCRCETVDEAVKGADILIHEATYMEPEMKLAQEFHHSTALSAAHTAADCGCGTLFLVHISNRYKDREAPRAEARRIFRYTYAPADLEMYHTTVNGVRSV